MKTRWFRPWGLIYRPVSAAGYLLTLAAAAVAVNGFLAVDRRSHSVSDTLYGIFPFWVPALLLWLWLAERTSRPADSEQ